MWHLINIVMCATYFVCTWMLHWLAVGLPLKFQTDTHTCFMMATLAFISDTQEQCNFTTQLLI